MKKLLIIITTVLLPLLSIGQTDDLMIIEYVDWDGGSGYAVKIYNPTNASINLSNYKITRYADGDPVVDANDQADLAGTLAPNQFKIFGNNDYKGKCSSNTIVITGIAGTNGEDAIAITKGSNNQNIDMVGAWGSKTEITIGGNFGDDALLHNKIVRKNDNCIRYFDKAGTTIHSWPNNTTNVPEWNVFPSNSAPNGCLSQSQVNFQLPNFELDADTTLCIGEELDLNYNSFGFDSYEWIGENNKTASITIKEEGNYTLEVGKNFCLVRDEINVTFEECDSIINPPLPSDSIYVPNVITPNNDGINEYFVINGFNEIHSLIVFNKWGKEVYNSPDYDNSWQATGLIDGSYFYLITEGFVEIKGWVEVKR